MLLEETVKMILCTRVMVTLCPYLAIVQVDFCWN